MILKTMVSAIKDKILSVLFIVVLTLLAGSLYVNHIKENDLINLRERVVEQAKLNEDLSKANKSLSDELSTRPKEYIEITKEVTNEMCEGRIAEERILNAPKTVKEDTDEKGYVDIDAPFDPEFVKLLK